MNLQATSEVDRSNEEAIVRAVLGQSAETEAPEATEAEEPNREAEVPVAEEESSADPAEEIAEASDEEVPASEPEEQAEEAEPTEAAEEEEGEFALQETDRDYSDAAYARAAQHYSKTHKVQLDPQDPAHRAMLKEIMDRGEALKRQAEERKAMEQKADEAKASDEEKPVQAHAPTPEQFQAYLNQIGEIAKRRVNPAVAMHVSNRIVKALWPDFKGNISQEQANDLTSAFHEMFMLALDDAAPMVLGMVNNNLASDPVWGRTRTEAIRANAFEHLESLKDATGEMRYPDLEQMVESGRLKKVMAANPWISAVKSGKGNDPVLDYAAQIEVAYKIAKGEQVNPDVVRKAVETGRKQAAETAKKVAASRVAPGKPKGGFSGPVNEAEKIIGQITRGPGTKSNFSEAVKQQLMRRR